MTDSAAWAASLGLLGAIFGSFIATVALRARQGGSALSGRSMCDGCGRVLRPVELVPLLSWVALRGRCQRCGDRIAWAHPATELAGAAIGVAAGMFVPGPEGAWGAAIGWLLLALAALDLTKFWLPDRLNAALAVLALAGGIAGWGVPVPDRLIGGLAGFGSLWAVAQGYRRLRGRVGLGGGDPKLFGAIGLWLGWRALPMVLLGASVLGLIAILAMQVAGRKVAPTSRIPFGAPLALAAFALWIALRG